MDNILRLVDEALALGFSEILFTGGEPFILPDIYEMLSYSSQRLKTSVLTNATLLKGKRLDRLFSIANEALTIQVSLDGGRPEHHDAYRGQGSWQPTVAAIQLLQEHGLHIRISTTQTPANRDHLEKLCIFHRSLGIPEEDHLIRPLARRGFSTEGLDLTMQNIMPEVSVNLDGVFWHPLSTDTDMQVSRQIFPLASAVKTIQDQLAIIESGGVPLITFT